MGTGFAESGRDAGYDCDPAFRSDGDAEFSNGYRAVLEMDRESESVVKVLRRLSIHEGHDRDILFLTLSEPRIDKLALRLGTRWPTLVVRGLVRPDARRRACLAGRGRENEKVKVGDRAALGIGCTAKP